MFVRTRRPAGFSMIELMVVIAIIAILFAIFAANFMHAKAEGKQSACESNLKNVATALEAYANDNNNRFPSSLASIVPSHLATLPTCPSAGTVTYSTGYSVAVGPDAYTVACAGSNHTATGNGPNFPRFCSGVGLQRQ